MVIYNTIVIDSLVSSNHVAYMAVSKICNFFMNILKNNVYTIFLIIIIVI